MENWEVIPSSAVHDYTLAIVCSNSQYLFFASDIGKIFKLIAKNNGDYQKDFTQTNITIIIVGFENEANFMNFKKDFENLKI